MTQDTATLEGAEELTPAYRGRTSAIQEIARNAHANVAPDLAGIDEETGQVVPYEKPQENKEPEKPEDTGQNAKQQASSEPNPEPIDDAETIIVDGKEVRVKRDQLIDAGRRTLQKEAAADRRLREATETLNRARAYESAMLRTNGQPSNPDAGQNSQMPPEQDASNRSGAQESTPDIGALVDQRIWLRDADKASNRFKTEFQDIVGDPLAMRLVVQLENERLSQAQAEGIPLGDPWEAYQDHGVKVRQWLGKAKTQAPEIPEDKTERKRATTTVAGAGARLPQPSTPKTLTVQEQIEAMRKARAGKPIQTQR